MKRVLIGLLSLFLFLNPVSFVVAEEYDEDITEEYEDYSEETEEAEEVLSDYELCVYHKDKDACTRVRKEQNNSIKELENQISEAEADQEKARELARKYSQEAEGLQGEIDALYVKIEELKTQISELNTSIEEKEKSIAENQAVVDQLHNRVLSRMVESQKTMHFNHFLDFLLGATSFYDMLGRIYSIQAIMAKDEADRNKLLDIIKQLEIDKEELNNQKILLEDSKAELDVSFQEVINKQYELELMQEFYEEEAARIQDELDQMTAERDEIYESFEELGRRLKEINMIVNTGFVPAVKNS